MVWVGQAPGSVRNALGQVLVEEGLGIGVVLSSICRVQLCQEHVQARDLDTILIRIAIALQAPNRSLRLRLQAPLHDLVLLRSLLLGGMPGISRPLDMLELDS